MYKIKNDSGFTILHGLLAFVVIFIVGFAGWYVSRSQADTKKQNDTTTSPVTSSDGNNTDEFKLPKDWKWYESKELGFKFAYPSAFGDISEKTEFCCGLTKSDFPEVDSQFYSTASSNGGIEGLKGGFYIENYKQGVNEILSRKYGPKVRMMPNDGRWVVSKTNDADPAQYRLGMIYEEVTTTKKGDFIISTFTNTDEGLRTHQLVFMAKDRWHMLSLPNFDTGEGLGDGPVKKNDQKPYDELRDQVIKSISLVK